MDKTEQNSVSPKQLYGVIGIGIAGAPLIIDVGGEPAFASDQWVVAGAVRRPPDAVERWQQDIARNRAVIVYCAHGGEISQGVAANLRERGIAAAYLEGGIAGWTEERLPLRRKT